MIVVLPICAGDAAAMLRLLGWIKRLGTVKAYPCLIVAEQGTPMDQVFELHGVATEMFASANLITNERHLEGWPLASNSLFLAAAKWCAEPFLWLEADCVPLRPGWLDEISNAWAAVKPEFLGHMYSSAGWKYMSGIAVYTPEGVSRFHFLPNSPRAWDVDEAEFMVAHGAHTPLIHHFWGQQNLPPTFAHSKTPTSSVNTITLANIPAEAVLFHRNKDGTLIRLLEQKFFPKPREKIAVCFPVYQGDIGLAIWHALWMQQMGRRHEHRAVICHDPSCPVILLNEFELLLRKSFSEVESFVYARPPIAAYPAAANFAFQSVALHMAKGKSPWLWFEADAVALKPNWLEQIQAEYDNCGRSWMGPVVQHMNHLQGTSVYPADAALRMPSAMSCGEQHAFDMAAHSDTVNDRHDAGHLMFHLWTLVGRMACPVGGGEIPVNITAAEVSRWLPKSAVFCHRIKDNSLIRLLMAGQFKP